MLIESDGRPTDGSPCLASGPKQTAYPEENLHRGSAQLVALSNATESKRGGLPSLHKDDRTESGPVVTP